MVSMKKTIYLVTTFVFVSILFPMNIFAQQKEQSFKGEVVDIKEIPCSEEFEETYTCFEYTVVIQDSEKEVLTSPILSETGKSKFQQGDKVFVTSLSDEFGNEQWSITGYNRDISIILLVLLFSFLAIVIGKRQGIGSLLSLIFTVFILYTWAVPKILEGSDVIFIGVLTVMITLVVIMYASHGLNRKSTVGILSTVVGIALVGILAKIFSVLIKVDGTGSEEAFLLLSQTGGGINLSDIFFVSILIGSMGVLDDVVMSQVSAIQELYKANSKLTTKELYIQAMNIGRDHISSMINTLFIAYAGSSLATVMLLTYSSGGIGNILQIDYIAEEIVRTITSSIGILLVVPISSIIGANLIPKGIFKKDNV
jgi:uncharacterized membrane protein